MLRRITAAALAVVALALPVSTGSVPMAAAAPPCTVLFTLVPNSRSTLVRCLERRLVALGYQIGTPDTVYDPVSVAAVKSFQLSRGLYDDGKVTSIAARQLGLRGTPAPADAPKVTIIGDSTSAAMRWYDEIRNSTDIYDIMGSSYDLRWSIESCRRLVAPSCVGRFDPGQGIRWRPVSVLPLIQNSLRGRVGDALVIMSGYDDSPRLNDEIDQIVTEAEQQGVTRIFWLTYRTTSRYTFGGFYLSHNRDLRAAQSRHPNLVLLDWDAFTHGQPFATQQDWFEKDGIHMTRSGAIALASFLKKAVDGSDVKACQASHATAGVAPDTAGNSLVTASPGGFLGFAPRRVFDSRYFALGGGRGKVGANRKISINLSGRVPAGTTSVVVSLTATRPCAAGAVTAYACGVRPTKAQLRLESGRATTATAIVPLSGSTLCVHTSAATELQVDVTGAFGDGGALFHPVQPVHWLDTRGVAAQLPNTGALPSGRLTTVQVGGLGAVPADATGAWMNLTAYADGAAGAIAVEPGGCADGVMRTTSLAVPRGRAASAAVLVALDGSGSMCVLSTGGPLHVSLDLVGWFGGTQPGGLAFQAQAVSRLLGGFTPPTITPTSPLSVNAGQHPVLNVTASRSLSAGDLQTAPCGATSFTSLLRTAWSEPVANLGTIDVAAGTSVCLRATTTARVIVDRVGAFVAPIG